LASKEEIEEFLKENKMTIAESYDLKNMELSQNQR